MTRSLSPVRTYRTDETTRLLAKLRRDALRANGWCVNGKHAKASHGVRCERCAAIHRGDGRIRLTTALSAEQTSTSKGIGP